MRLPLESGYYGATMSTLKLEPSAQGRQAEDGGNLDFLVGTLRNLARVARDLDMVPFETDDSSSAEADLVPLVSRILAMSVTVLDKLVAHYENLDEAAITGPVQSEAGPQQAKSLADLCVVGRMELYHRGEELKQVSGQSDHWDLISACNSSRGSLIKVAVAVENAICERESWNSELEPAYDRSVSVEVRRAYVHLRQGVAELGSPDEGSIEDHLRHAEELIDEVVRSDVQKKLRVSDRCHLKRLQQKLKTWLAAGRGADHQSGFYLWQDFVAVVEMLMQINNREDLVQGDKNHAEKLLASFEKANSSLVQIPEDLLGSLRALYGRDAELDRVIRLLDEGIEDRLRSILQRIVLQLDAGARS